MRAHPSHRLVATVGRAGPVEEVGAAVVGDLHVAGEQRVGVERRRQADDRVRQRPVHRVVGEHDDHRVLPAPAGLQHVDEPADLVVDGGQRGPPGGLERRTGEVGVADAVAVAEVDEDQVGVELVDHRQRGVHRELVGRVAADRDDRLRLPAVRGAGAEDAVEVLLRQHGAGREPVPVEPLDDGREVQVGRPVEVADGLLVAVVDGVGRHAAAVGPHAGHHHHVVGDGLHDGHRPGAREVRAVVTQQAPGAASGPR